MNIHLSMRVSPLSRDTIIKYEKFKKKKNNSNCLTYPKYSLKKGKISKNTKNICKNNHIYVINEKPINNMFNFERTYFFCVNLTIVHRGWIYFVMVHEHFYYLIKVLSFLYFQIYHSLLLLIIYSVLYFFSFKKKLFIINCDFQKMLFLFYFKLIFFFSFENKITKHTITNIIIFVLCAFLISVFQIILFFIFLTHITKHTIVITKNYISISQHSVITQNFIFLLQKTILLFDFFNYN